MTVKGQAVAAYDPRGIKRMGLGYATSNRGACHLRAYTPASELGLIPAKSDPLPGRARASGPRFSRICTRFPTAALAKFSLELNATNGDIRRKTAELGEQALKLAHSGNLQHDVIGPLVTEVDHLESRVAELEQQLANIRTAPTASG